MRTYEFLGYVVPSEPQITVTLLPSGRANLRNGKYCEIEGTIVNSRISIKCMSPFEDSAEDMKHWHQCAVHYAQTPLNLACFRLGYNFQAVLDKIVYEGKTSTISFSHDELAKLVTAFDSTNVDQALLHVMPSLALTRALNDLRLALAIPMYAPIGCARSVDAIRAIISPGLSTKDSWKRLQQTLNMSETYLKLITDASARPRHGEVEYREEEELAEVVKRSWTVMNRYLEFLNRGGNVPLSGEIFPLLSG